MASATIGNLNVRLGMDSAEFQAGAKRAQATLSGLGASIKNFAAGAVAALSIDMVARAAIEAVKAVAELGDVAESIGITAEQMQNYNRMALASGASSDVMAKGLQSIAEQSVDANSKLSQLFAANGFNAQAMQTNDVIRTFATLLQNARNPAEQLAIATTVLGDKVGRGLVEAMRVGADGVDSAFKDMVKSGEYHSNAEVARLQELETQYNKVMANIATRWQQMIVGMVTAADDLVNGPKNFNPQNLPGRFGPMFKNPNYVAPGSMPRTSGFGTTGGPNEFSGAPLPVKITNLPPSLQAKTTATSPASTPRSVMPSLRSPSYTQPITIEDIRGEATAWDDVGDSMSYVSKETKYMNEVTGTLANSFSSMIGSAIDGTFNLRSAIGSLVTTLSDSFIQQALGGLLNPASVAPSQASGGLLGNLFGGFAGLFADGGSIAAGKWGIAGERGPEIVRGPASVHPGGMGGVTVVQNFHGVYGEQAMARVAKENAYAAVRDAQNQQARITSERRLRAE